MDNIKQKIKLKNLLNWVYNVFNIGMNDYYKGLWFNYKTEINNSRSMTQQIYNDLKIKLLSLGVAIEYRDNEDRSGDRKTKLYRCYKKEKGKISNDLNEWVQYILQFYHKNTLVAQIEQIRQKISRENKPIVHYKKYFELKNKLIEVVSDGMRNEYGTFEENYKVVAQGYEQGDEYINRELQRLKQKKQTERTMTGIMNGYTNGILS